MTFTPAFTAGINLNICKGKAKSKVISTSESILLPILFSLKVISIIFLVDLKNTYGLRILLFIFYFRGSLWVYIFFTLMSLRRFYFHIQLVLIFYHSKIKTPGSKTVLCLHVLLHILHCLSMQRTLIK